MKLMRYGALSLLALSQLALGTPYFQGISSIPTGPSGNSEPLSTHLAPNTTTKGRIQYNNRQAAAAAEYTERLKSQAPQFQ